MEAIHHTWQSTGELNKNSLGEVMRIDIARLENSVTTENKYYSLQNFVISRDNA